jgi:hypothetical protein
MAKTKPHHIVDWYSQCRVEVDKLNAVLPGLSIEEKLNHIRQQYVILARIDKIFKGNAYFVGVPRPRGLKKEE